MRCKLLKLRLFKLIILLDTHLLRLIRFRQKVLMDFKPPLELFSLERKGRPVAGWPFRFSSQFSVLSCQFSVKAKEPTTETRRHGEDREGLFPVTPVASR